MPLSNKNQEHYHNGFETKPKTPAYQPYALNSLGFPQQQAFVIASPVEVRSQKALDPVQWNALAIDATLIPVGSQLHDFQVVLPWLSRCFFRKWLLCSK
jgi:hypothetical protein